MISKKQLFYASGVVLPAIAMALVGVHAATPTTQTNSATLTDAQKAAVQQAQELRKQADDILEKAGLPVRAFGRFHHPSMGERPQLTDDQKTAMKQAMDLRKEGKEDEAKAVLEKAGITLPTGRGFGHGPMHGASESANN